MSNLGPTPDKRSRYEELIALLSAGAILPAYGTPRREREPHKFSPAAGVGKRRAKRKMAKQSRKKNRS